MIYLGAKRWLTVAMITVALLWTTSAYAAVPAAWKDTGFSINADGMTLREVLNEFGVVYGVRVASSINDDTTMRGRLKADNGSEFLDRLTQAYKFRWFVFNDTLYIVPRNDNTSARLEVGEDAVQDAKSALVGMGLFDNRFGWGELPDEGIVMISGPREYVKLAREILLPETKKDQPKGKQIMVFRLKYASATDRVINMRGQKEMIPGIKTILTGLLNAGSPSYTTSRDEKFDVGSEKRSRQTKNSKGGAREVGDSRSSDRDDMDDYADSRAKPKHYTKNENRPRIDADASLNAIIIYDDASKREMYKNLIADLDVEPQQIEIEALIVDIDRSKLSDMGVEWGVRSGNTTTTMNGTKADSRGTDLPLPGSTLLISNAARFYARLRALEGSGEANVLAKPTVLTLDNVAAVLDLSQTSYVPLVGERVADLANVTAGTMLRVVPRIVREGASTRVRLEVDIEDGSLNDQTQKNTVATRSTISTQAIIDLQQTLMIGGYHAESRSRDLQKVPVLGDVPLFGGLFRNEAESNRNRERLFLITPRLVGTTGAPAPVRSRAGETANRMTKAEDAGSLKQSVPQLTPVAPQQTAPVAPQQTAPAAPQQIAPPRQRALQNNMAETEPVSKIEKVAAVQREPEISPVPNQAETATQVVARKTATKLNCARPAVGFRTALY